MTGMRSISVMCVVLGNMANLDAERGRRSPKISSPFRGCLNRCEPTAHRSVRKVFLPPPHHRAECLWEPPAAAWLDVG
jgi:hypothetical protein